MFEEWKKKAAAAGLTLSDLCKLGGISRDTIQRWKNDDFTASIRSFNKINNLLEKTTTEQGLKEVKKLLKKLLKK